MLQEFRKVQLVDNADAAVAASGEPNGVNLLVVEITLEMGGTIGIVAGKNEVLVKEAVVVNGDKALLPKPFDGIGHLFAQHTPRRSGYRYL